MWICFRRGAILFCTWHLLQMFWIECLLSNENFRVEPVVFVLNQCSWTRNEQIWSLSLYYNKTMKKDNQEWSGSNRLESDQTLLFRSDSGRNCCSKGHYRDIINNILQWLTLPPTVIRLNKLINLSRSIEWRINYES